MEYLKKEELFKNRGYAKCITYGYHILVDNYKSIFSYTWKSALAFCLVSIIALTISNVSSSNGEVTDLIVYTVMGIAFLLSQCYFISNIVNIFTERGKLTVFKRMLVLMLFKFVVIALLYLFFTSTITFSIHAQYPWEVVLLVMAVVSIILFVFTIPFAYIFVKYLFEDNGNFFKVVSKSYYKGLRHWGLIFVTLMLSVLMVLAISIVIALPLYMLLIAKAVSLTGVFFGDADGMPSYFPYIFAITVSVISVILIYLYTFVFSTLYYTYGTIEQRENERRGFMENSMNV